MERLLYPIPEALAQVPVSRTTLYEEIAKGSIRVVKIGRRTFIAHDELERYVRTLTGDVATREKLEQARESWRQTMALADALLPDGDPVVAAAREHLLHVGQVMELAQEMETEGVATLGELMELRRAQAARPDVPA